MSFLVVAIAFNKVEMVFMDGMD